MRVFDSNHSRAWLPVSLVGVGAAIAFAHVLPPALRHPILVLATLAWLLAAARESVVLGKGIKQSLLAGSELGTSQKWLLVIGVIAVLVVLIAVSQLWLVRLSSSNGALFWNVDWRYALTHAQAIARFGGLDQSLDYTGSEIAYHVGPAWIAAALQRLIGIPVESTLFGLIPALSTFSIAALLLTLARKAGAATEVAWGAVGGALLLPAAHLTAQQLYWNPTRLFYEDNAAFGVATMLNGYVATAIGFASLVLLQSVARDRRYLAIGALGLCSLVAIKPQYFLGIGLFLAIITTCGLFRTFSFQTRLNPNYQLAAPSMRIGALLVATLLLVLLPKLLFGQPSATVFSGAIAFILLLSLTSGWVEYPDRDTTMGFLATGVGALVTALVLVQMIPGAPSFFGAPRLAVGAVGWTDQLYFSIFAILFSTTGISIGLASSKSEKVAVQRLFGYAWYSFASMAILTILLQTIAFPIKDELLNLGRALGGYDVGELRQHKNLVQSIAPLKTLLIFGCIATVLSCIAHIQPKKLRVLLTTVSVAVIAFLLAIRVVMILPGFTEPQNGYEATADHSLRDLLATVPVEGSLLISSDIADSADGYLRAANATALPAFFGHSFYASDLRYMNWVRDDARHRLTNLELFFGTDWTDWHSVWLGTQGITHVLTNQRCIPAWFDKPGKSLTPAREFGDWVLFEVQHTGVSTMPVETPIVGGKELKSAFGRAECLALKQKAVD